MSNIGGLRMLIRSAIAGLLLCLCSCAATPQANEACVSSCTSGEPEHSADCEAACLAYDGDAALAAADVKEHCELTEDPPPVPTSTEKWKCDGVQAFLPGCLDVGGSQLDEVTSPKSAAAGFANSYDHACLAAKSRAQTNALQRAGSVCVWGANFCEACVQTP